LYSIRKSDGIELRAKGVQSSAVENQLTFNDYKNVLQNNGKVYVKCHRISSVKHKLTSVTQNKVGLVSNDDKRVDLHDEGYNTLAHGHYRINDDGTIGDARDFGPVAVPVLAPADPPIQAQPPANMNSVAG
jgi:hypothetical protein